MATALHVLAAVYLLGIVWILAELKFNCPILEWHD